MTGDISTALCVVIGWTLYVCHGQGQDCLPDGPSDCDFEPGPVAGKFCGWERNHWRRRGRRREKYAYLNSSTDSSLESSLVCATGDSPHCLQFDFYISDSDSHNLSVVIAWPHNDSTEQLWHSDADADWEHVAVPISSNFNFSIHLRARREINNNDKKIRIDNITYTDSPCEGPTTPPALTTSSTAPLTTSASATTPATSTRTVTTTTVLPTQTSVSLRPELTPTHVHPADTTSQARQSTSSTAAAFAASGGPSGDSPTVIAVVVTVVVLVAAGFIVVFVIVRRKGLLCWRYRGDSKPDRLHSVERVNHAYCGPVPEDVTDTGYSAINCGSNVTPPSKRHDDVRTMTSQATNNHYSVIREVDESDAAFQLRTSLYSQAQLLTSATRHPNVSPEQDEEGVNDDPYELSDEQADVTSAQQASPQDDDDYKHLCFTRRGQPGVSAGPASGSPAVPPYSDLSSPVSQPRPLAQSAGHVATDTVGHNDLEEESSPQPPPQEDGELYQNLAEVGPSQTQDTPESSPQPPPQEDGELYQNLAEVGPSQTQDTPADTHSLAAGEATQDQPEDEYSVLGQSVRAEPSDVYDIPNHVMTSRPPDHTGADVPVGLNPGSEESPPTSIYHIPGQTYMQGATDMNHSEEADEDKATDDKSLKVTESASTDTASAESADCVGLYQVPGQKPRDNAASVYHILQDGEKMATGRENQGGVSDAPTLAESGDPVGIYHLPGQKPTDNAADVYHILEDGERMTTESGDPVGIYHVRQKPKDTTAGVYHIIEGDQNGATDRGFHIQQERTSELAPTDPSDAVCRHLVTSDYNTLQFDRRGQTAVPIGAGR